MERMKIEHIISTLLIVLSSIIQIYAKPGDKSEPVRYVGPVTTSNSDYDSGYHDGQFRPAVGVQNYQILRANRTHPELADDMGWTYNHAPMLTYWNGMFYCIYLSNPTGEHIPPGVTLVAMSKDGKNWSKPQVIFPIYFLPGEGDWVDLIHMHQRMAFYVAPDGRLLAFGFYGGNKGDGVGRVVREVYKDNTFGPIYSIKANFGRKKDMTYPMYTESNDKGFVSACDAFLNDKVKRIQWWEEDRTAANKDDFYRVPWIMDDGEKSPGQAFCYYTRPDSVLVGFFKARWTTLSFDQGESWSEPVQCNTLSYAGAKIWAQRMDNGQYALVYNPTGGLARHPLSIATGDDGIHFDNLLNVHSEVPLKRFWGREKRPGPQYVRGIIEGNGNPPGNDLWVVYSVSKEDMWISRIPVPVRGDVTGPINDNFNEMETGGVVTDWNVYSPKWCPVEVVVAPYASEKCLMLKDVDPYDYAKAVRVFNKSEKQQISFDLYAECQHQVLDVEVVSAKGERLVQARFDTTGSLLVKKGNNNATSVTEIESGKWYTVMIDLDAKKEQFNLSLNDEKLVTNAAFSAKGTVPERIIFRTGDYRLTNDVTEYKSGDQFVPGFDEKRPDDPVAPVVYYLKNFRTRY